MAKTTRRRGVDRGPLKGGLPDARRAKIVCTMGPASNSEAAVRELMRAGMDVARLNFSHGSYDQHAATITRLRRVAEAEGRTLCILQDLQGPKIRTGKLKGHVPVPLVAGARTTITPRAVEGTASLIPTTFAGLADEVQPGSRILLADGLIELRVEAVRGREVECRVVNGGELGENKGINLPGAAIRVPALTDKDRRDVAFGLEHGVDMVAVSFVRTAADVLAVKRLLQRHKRHVPIIAKLEKPQAIEHLEEVLEAADSVMVARGDLGVEVEPEKVPIIQKHVIRRASEWRKPVITATQMLESMVENPRPTRAEASDVANAIFDGTDAVMLSAETATGKYPREAVAIMARIIVETEAHMRHTPVLRHRRERRDMTIAETICESMAHAARDLSISAVAAYTESGTTARLVSKYRTDAEIYAFTPSIEVANRMNLLWGVHPLTCAGGMSSDEMVLNAERCLLASGKVRQGDVMGVVAGTQHSSGSTNFLRLHVIGADAAPGRRGKRRS